MECYRCEAKEELMPLAPLYPYERMLYPQANVVIRKCLNCGLEQSHVGDGEVLTAETAAQTAPEPIQEG
jgi:hypothetical protein